MSLGRFLENQAKTSEELERLLRIARTRRRSSAKLRLRLGRFPALFRRLCQDLALARHRDYSTTLVSRLNQQALQSHHQMYAARSGPWRRLARFLAADFPRAVRSEPWTLFWSVALMFGVAPVIAILIQEHPELAYSILGTAQLSTYETMYDTGTGQVNVERPADSDVFMFGFYFFNNIGVAFRTFAGGVFLGLGTIYFLLMNGILLGAVAGHLHRIGAGGNLYSFVIGHGAFELTAICIAGVAGLVLGRSLIAVGQRTRLQSFLEGGRRCAPLVCGAACMLVIAAFIAPHLRAAQRQVSGRRRPVGPGHPLLRTVRMEATWILRSSRLGCARAGWASRSTSACSWCGTTPARCT